MYKKIIFGCVAILFAAASAFNIGLIQTQNAGDISLDAITIMAQAHDGEAGNNLWRNYENHIIECKITETKFCDLDIWIPGYGYCHLGFHYKVKHDGLTNICRYTGNPDHMCDYYRCTANG